MDGTASGTGDDDIITMSYPGDPEGDVVDGNDAVAVTVSPDDDVIEGGDGDDTLKGDADADTIVGGAGSDWLNGGAGRGRVPGGAGDQVVSGGSEGDDLDVLDLRGLPPYRIEGLMPDANGNGFDGRVVFLDADGGPTGESFAFTEIEDFLEGGPGPVLDSIVEGTNGDDLIDPGYVGDPEGDRVDANDALLPGQRRHHPRLRRR